MNRKASNVDGFVKRVQKAPRRTFDDMENVKAADGLRPVAASRASKKRQLGSDIDADIMESLADLPGYDNLGSDDFAEPAKVNKKALKKAKKKGKKRKKPLKIILIILGILVVLAAAAFVALKYLWPDDSFDGDIMGFFQTEKLQEDANGRSNILVFGTAPDGYDGPLLADTILMVSLNQTDKSVYMVSLPRDLWVKHTCPNPELNTTAGKLNETYLCALDSEYYGAKQKLDENVMRDKEAAAEGAFRDKVGEILGLDVQYSVHLEWQGLVDVIDAVGGVDVVIESDDPRGIYDVNTGLKYPNGPAHLDGQAALTMARARGVFGGYGLEDSNYAREKHQQMIVKALQAKASSAGVLTNPVTFASMVTAFGNNVRTNFQTSELRALADVAKGINLDNMISLPLLDPDKGINLVKNDNIGGASVVVPMAGTFVYSAIHDYIRQSTSADPVVREAAIVDVLNGTDTPGVAQHRADGLKDKGYKIGVVGNAPAGSYADIEVYQVNANKSGTAKALAELYGVEIKNVIPAGFDTVNVDFIVVVGAATEDTLT
jgi:LCP family protein required for cell wall assembly